MSEQGREGTGEVDRRGIRPLRPEFSRFEDLCAYAELVITAAVATCARSRELREQIRADRAARMARRADADESPARDTDGDLR
jgi:hypothetical protein